MSMLNFFGLCTLREKRMAYLSGKVDKESDFEAWCEAAISMARDQGFKKGFEEGRTQGRKEIQSDYEWPKENTDRVASSDGWMYVFNHHHPDDIYRYKDEGTHPWVQKKDYAGRDWCDVTTPTHLSIMNDYFKPLNKP